jgi:uncharacterized flavoprotein (TIGR03862 family)
MSFSVAVIGAGPAGLIAAEILSAGGAAVTVYDRMPSVARKFLMAGRGGLNLTHSELFESFVTSYGAAASRLRPMLEEFPPQALVDWANGLGAETFVGSSGRVFPKAMKASPLLRAWLARLTAQGVTFRLRHDWRGWNPDGALVFDALGSEATATPGAALLALGGASWPRLGSDGGWVRILSKKGVTIAPLQPANSGFSVGWSDVCGDRAVRGEAVVTRYGIEGGAIYALSSVLRDTVAFDGNATLEIDLRPGQTEEQLTERLTRPRGKESLSNHLRKALNLSPPEIGLLREVHGAALVPDADRLARNVKHVQLKLVGAHRLDRAISTAGGVSFDSVDDDLMLKVLPNVHVAGEMLDWEAPTGGYLLQASFATGAFAARAILRKMAA